MICLPTRNIVIFPSANGETQFEPGVRENGIRDGLRYIVVTPSGYLASGAVGAVLVFPGFSILAVSRRGYGMSIQRTVRLRCPRCLT